MMSGGRETAAGGQRQIAFSRGPSQEYSESVPRGHRGKPASGYGRRGSSSFAKKQSGVRFGGSGSGHSSGSRPSIGRGGDSSTSFGAGLDRDSSRRRGGGGRRRRSR
jgi:hypothetical protein